MTRDTVQDSSGKADAGRRLLAKVLLATSAVVCVSGPVLSQSADPGAPRLVHQGTHFQLEVDGAPFLMLGGQAHNSSASNLNDAEAVYKALDGMYGNTAEMPVSWNLVEPQPGQFDFSLVDGLIDHARQHHLKLVFLWFGTTKNATFSYVPDWIKQDRKTYFRAQDTLGQPMNAISPFCDAAQKADQRAFAALMHHIHDFDGHDHTVLLMQVENETGLIHTDRDYSPAANQHFGEPVPEHLMSYLQAHRATLRPALQAAMQSGGKPRGTWTEVFGDMAPEVFSAWATSRYVDGVAAAGKTEYPIPFYINVALMNTGAPRPGDWPSGGATANVIDIWKANAPHIDVVAPDIYRVDFPEIADIYDRPDNPLFVPETGFAPYYAPYVFTTLAGHNGLGFSPFGVDGGTRRQDVGDGYSETPGAQHREASTSPAAASVEENYRILRPLLPLIASKRYQDSLFPVVLNFYRHEALAIPVGDGLSAVIHFDELFAANVSTHRAGGILIKLAPDRFIVAGHGFHVNFTELKGPPRDAEFLEIEEGTYEGDHWVRQRVLNGDEERVTLPVNGGRTLMVHLNRDGRAK